MAIDELGDKYYSDANNIKYFSVSQLKDFMKCEAQTMAVLRGDIPRPYTEAFTQGNYIHSYYESEEAHKAFLKERENEIYTIRALKREDVVRGYKDVLHKLLDESLHETINDEIEKAVLKTAFNIEKEIARLIKGLASRTSDFSETMIETIEEHLKEHTGALHVPKREKKAAYILLDKMIETLNNDEMLNDYLTSGEKETDATGTIEGVPFKIRVDVLDAFRSRFVDLKTVANMDKKFYNKELGRYVPFIIEYGYHVQMYVYREIIKQNFDAEMTPYIVAISKEETPNKELFVFDDEILNHAERIVKESLPRFAMVKNGDLEPRQCGKCEWCKRTKKIEYAKSVSELIQEF